MAVHPVGRSGRHRQRPREYPAVTVTAPGLSERHAQAEAAKAARPPVPPVAAEDSRWDDPEDRVNTRSPKQVRGFRRGDAVGRMHRRGTDITRDHVEAANRFRADWDNATIGLSGEPQTERVSSGSPMPRTGPRAVDVAQLAARREVSRVQALIGIDGWPLLSWVVLDNGDIAGWVRANAARCRDLDPKKEFGRLLFMLGRLAEFYGIDSRRDELRRARRELAQP